jgi:hypothetical protein
MKSFSPIHSRNVAADRAAQKSSHIRHSAAKQAEHRYERRKVREFLRHNLDDEDASARFEQFG